MCSSEKVRGVDPESVGYAQPPRSAGDESMAALTFQDKARASGAAAWECGKHGRGFVAFMRLLGL